MQCTGNLEILESEDLVLGTDERGYHLKIRTGSLLLMDSCRAESVQELAPVLLAYVDLIAAANWYLGIHQAKTFVHSMLLDNLPTSLCHHHSCQSCCQGHHFPRSCQSYCHGCLLMSKVLPEVVGYHWMVHISSSFQPTWSINSVNNCHHFIPQDQETQVGLQAFWVLYMYLQNFNTGTAEHSRISNMLTCGERPAPNQWPEPTLCSIANPSLTGCQNRMN